MKLAIVGLGRMGGKMAERLRGAGHDVVGYDRDPDKADVGALEDGAQPGAAKAPAVRRLVEGDRSIPAAHVEASRGLLLLDPAAAAQLPPPGNRT